MLDYVNAKPFIECFFSLWAPKSQLIWHCTQDRKLANPRTMYPQLQDYADFVEATQAGMYIPDTQVLLDGSKSSGETPDFVETATGDAKIDKKAVLKQLYQITYLQWKSNSSTLELQIQSITLATLLNCSSCSSL